MRNGIRSLQNMHKDEPQYIFPEDENKHKVPLIIDSGSNCKWSLTGDMIVKHLSFDLHPEWLTTYKKLREYEPRLVEVFEYRDRKMYMEYIDGLPIFPNITLEKYNEALDIMKNISQWNKDNNMCFINHACGLRNYLVENKTGKVYMIDADSFKFYG